MPNTIEIGTGKSKTVGNKNNEPQKKTLWAIIIGVNQYQDKNIENLNYSANDAVGLANTLETIATQKLPIHGATFDEVKIIVHAHTSNKYSRQGILPPTQNKILASLGLLSEAQSQDTVLFYFSGHGCYDDDKINDTVLCLEATSKNNLAATGLLITTVLAFINNSSAQQQLILLDACHSGGVASQLIDKFLQVTKNNTHLNLYCITACDRDQQSFETPYLQHGIFTHLLLEALEKRKAATLVKTDALYEFIVGEIETSIINIIELEEIIHHIKLNGEQKKSRQFQPQRIVVGNGEFILGAYPNPITDNRSRGALVLDGFRPSEDIVKISQSLARQGGFAYQPYPNQSESLQDSIAALLTSEVTETALLYLKGEFVTENDGAWLVCSDGARINVNWLAQQLQDSPIEQQIIIVDCYPTSDVKCYTKLLEQSEKSQCIIAISVANNCLSGDFSEIIANNSKNGLKVTHLLSYFSNSNICTSQQRHIYHSAHGILNVTLDEKQHLTDILIDRNFCPYKSLAAFTTADKDFYFGRESLIKEVIQQLKIQDFLLIVGASGSGKSSLVQAGVVPQWLEEDANSRQVWIMRPGIHPIQELAKALSQHTLFSELEDYCQGVAEQKLSPELLEGILHLGVESFVSWLRQQSNHQGLLVIDQFEEIFNKDISEIERELFLKLILGAVKAMDGSLKVLSTLRSDFITPWLEIPNLEAKLGQNLKEYSVFIPSELIESEYRDIITKPATRVGLAVEPELVNVLIEEVEAETGALPLLEFTLEHLWQNRTAGKLSLEVYRKKIGGIKQVLQERANDVYDGLTESQQQCAQWIFTQLVSLGEGKEDTKLRKDFQDLVVEKYPSDLVKSTLDKLIDSRLIVMQSEVKSLLPQSSKGLEENHHANSAINNSEVTVEIAHEILIRNWSTLRWWLDTNREHIRQRNRIEERAKQPEDLLTGSALTQVEEFYVHYSDELTEKAQDFISKSIESRDLEIEARERQIKEREEKDRLIKRGQRKVIASLTGGIFASLVFAGAALWQLRKATINEIEALNEGAEALLFSNQEFDSLIAGLKAGSKIKNSLFGVSNETRIIVLGILQNTFYKVREVNRLEIHSDSVTNIEFSPDSKTIASVGADNTVRLWNLKGQLLHTFEGHSDGVTVTHVEFSPDGQTIASASNDSRVKLWNLSGQLLQTFEGHSDGVTHVEFSPDGKMIVSAGRDGTVRLWNLKGQLLHTFEGHSDGVTVTHVEFSPDGQTIASAGRDGTVRLWNLSGQLLQTFEGHKFGVNSLAFSLDGKMIASAGADKTVRLWNLSGQLLHTFEGHSDGVTHVEFSPDGKMIASVSWDATVKLWNVLGSILQTFEGHKFGVNSLAFSPDGKMIASASLDNQIKLWNIKEKLINALKNYNVRVYHVEFSPDGKMIASAGADSTVRLWNLSGQLLHTFEGHSDGVTHVEFSPDGKMIVSAGRDSTVRLWNLSGQLLHTFEGHSDGVIHVEFSPDGQTIASASKDSTVRLWNLRGQLLHTLDDHHIEVFDVEFSPDGQTIASASGDYTVKLWNLQGHLLRTLKGHTDQVFDAEFSPDGKMIVSAGRDSTVRLWNLKGQLLHNLDDHKHIVNNVEFSPDGQTIASAGADNTVRLWNLRGQLLHTLKGHANNVIYLTFSTNDTKTLASVSWDATVKLWSLDLDNVMIRGCNWVKDYLANNPNVKPEDRKMCDKYYSKSSK